MRARRRIGFVAILLLLGALASAIVLEVGVGLLLGTQVRFPRRVVGAPFGVRINEPNAHYTHTSPDVHVEFRINGQGMRAPRDYAREKPAGTRRIVSLGDSFTIGYEVEADETFSAVLERELRARGYDVEVLNAGVSGYSNAEAALYLERELLGYQPDLVLVSFYGNDLVDNVRSGLFRVAEGRLEPAASSYVPGGRLGNFLNTNPLFNLLSEHSNAFALLKEQATLVAKRQMVSRNRAHVAGAESSEALGPTTEALGPTTGSRGPTAADAVGPRERERRLAAAIFERIHATARGAGASLWIQSIPSWRVDPERLVELFPSEYLDLGAEGLWFEPAARWLEPWVGRQPLYYERSHGHWTPLAHRLSGLALAERIDAEGVLGSGAPDRD